MIKHIKILALIAFVVSFSSCLKDKSYNDGTTGLNVAEGNRMVQLGGAYQAADHNTYALDFKDETVKIEFVVGRLLSGGAATEDITITLDTTGLSSGPNSILPAGVVKFPNAFYTNPGGFTLTIPKGEKEGTLELTTNSIQFDPSLTYGLGFKIASVSPAQYQAAANFSTFYTTVGAKNQYDGVYEMDFTNYHPSANPGYTGASTTVEMHTIGANTNKMYWPLAGAYGIPAILNGGFSYFGAQEPAYTVNPATGAVTVANTVGTVVYGLNGSFNSRYDAATRTYYVKFGYNYDPGGVFNPANNREWTQTFKWIGPR